MKEYNYEMIRLAVRFRNHRTEISFPCSDRQLYEKMTELGLPNPSVAKVEVVDVQEPEEFSGMQWGIVDLDEVNFLAKKIESFWGNEGVQFLESMRLEGFTDLKDLINLSFNLDKYTLIQDISDMAEVGREYVMNTEGGIPVATKDDPKYAEIGWKILQSGQGIFTEHGYLVPDRSRSFEEVYNGRNFPAYLYTHCTVVGTLRYANNEEFVYLPDDEIAIDKAIMRLGATDISQCEIKLTDIVASEDRVANTLTKAVGTSDVYELNRFLNKIAEYIEPTDMGEIVALMEYTGMEEKEAIVQLAEHSHAFGILRRVTNYEELAKAWLEKDEHFDLLPEHQQFFDYEGFGKKLAEEYQGKFVEGDIFVYMQNGYHLEDIISSDENESIEMGGI